MAAMDGQQAMRENEFSPVVEGNLVHTGGETHVLNFDTNVLSLDNVRVPTEMTDGAENEIVESEDEEDEDIEVRPLLSWTVSDTHSFNMFLKIYITLKLLEQAKHKTLVLSQARLLFPYNFV